MFDVHQQLTMTTEFDPPTGGRAMRLSYLQSRESVDRLRPKRQNRAPRFDGPTALSLREVRDLKLFRRVPASSRGRSENLRHRH
jgi:hypothetical protein